MEVWFLSPNRPGSNLGLGPPQFSQGAADQTVILYINNIKKTLDPARLLKKILGVEKTKRR